MDSTTKLSVVKVTPTIPTMANSRGPNGNVVYMHIHTCYT
jgi:hypothetical protein